VNVGQFAIQMNGTGLSKSISSPFSSSGVKLITVDVIFTEGRRTSAIETRHMSVTGMYLV